MAKRDKVFGHPIPGTRGLLPRLGAHLLVPFVVPSSFSCALVPLVLSCSRAPAPPAPPAPRSLAAPRARVPSVDTFPFFLFSQQKHEPEKAAEKRKGEGRKGKASRRQPPARKLRSSAGATRPLLRLQRHAQLTPLTRPPLIVRGARRVRRARVCLGDEEGARE